MGSSIHAFMNSPAIKKIFAIDPDLRNLKIPRKSIPGAELIDEKDFSQIDFVLSGMKALVYFDDHIDTARRIIQASQKGFRYVLFDDSTGLEGICQRFYPAIPTIPMIMCSVPCDYIPRKSYPLFRAREYLQGLAEAVGEGRR